MPSPVELPNTGDNYWHVELGPIPNVPDWSVFTNGSSYAFPTREGAEAFASVHRMKDTGREVRVVPPNAP
jgi:hypothetical protein